MPPPPASASAAPLLFPTIHDVQTKQAHNTSNTSQTQDTSITGGQLATSVLVSEKANVDPAAATTSAKPIGGGNGNGGAADGGVDAGVDLSKGAYARGADEAGARVLCAWLNANIATTCMQVYFRHCVGNVVMIGAEERCVRVTFQLCGTSPSG